MKSFTFFYVAGVLVHIQFSILLFIDFMRLKKYYYKFIINVILMEYYVLWGDVAYAI